MWYHIITCGIQYFSRQEWSACWRFKPHVKIVGWWRGEYRDKVERFKIDLSFIWNPLAIPHLITDVGWKHLRSKQYLRIPEWRTSLSIRCLIHCFFCSQIRMEHGDGRGKKFQPLRWRIGSLASISVFRERRVPSQCFHFRVTHFLFFISFPERLSHSEENERRRVGTFRWKIDLGASKIWPFRYNSPVHWKCTRSIFLEYLMRFLNR